MTIPSLFRQQQVALPGILGGLGPLAHVYFEQRLIECSKQRGANCDQDYPVWLLVNASVIPDRTQSIQGKGLDCTPDLVRCAQWLEKAGADFLIVTCNTSHSFYDIVQAQLQIPWIHLMDCTTYHICRIYPDAKRIGVLATDGTLQCGLYSRSLNEMNLDSISFAINSPWQSQIMDTIYHPIWGIKSTGTQVSNQALDTLIQASDQLKRQGADVIIAGCTELSVGLSQIPSLDIPWIDPLEVAAALTLDLAWGECSLLRFQAA